MLSLAQDESDNCILICASLKFFSHILSIPVNCHVCDYLRLITLMIDV